MGDRYFGHLETENDKLLATFIEDFFFRFFKRKEKGVKDDPDGRRLELYTTSKCTSNCKYCYLHEHQNELYPEHCNNEVDILKNLKSVMKYYTDNQFVCDLELFGGEGITTGLTFKCLDIIYDSLSAVEREYRPYRISLPEDCKFISSKELTEKVQSYCDKFRKIGTILSISASVDGALMDENREKNNRGQDFYDDLFRFLDKNYLAAHPMVSAINIEKWIDNFNWWWETSKRLNIFVADRLMMLEVRNGDWTEEKIQQYIYFLNYIIDFYWEDRYKNNPREFAKRIAGKDNYPNKGYDNIALRYRTLKDGRFTELTCGLPNILSIRLGDMAIVPCHRTAYDKFVGGYFTTDENNKINGIKSNNVGVYISCYNFSHNIAAKCYSCSIKHWCVGQCLGSCYESNKELFLPIESVCNLYIAKNIFLLMKYEDLGILNLIKEELPPEASEVIDRQLKRAREVFTHYDQLFGDQIVSAKANGLPTTSLQL